MSWDLGMVFIGLVALVLGAEGLVRSASDIAARIGVPSSVIGLTLVAWGTSAPELVVSVDAAWAGTPDLAMGNVVGSNIFNILLILGVSGLIVPLTVHERALRLEWPVMFAAALLVPLVGGNGRIDRLEGLLLVSMMVGFTMALARRPRPAAEVDAWGTASPRGPDGSTWRDLGLLLGSVLLLAIGARGLVDGAVDLATALGVSERVIGLTLVAIGTSLPELFTSVVAALRRKDDIAIGNVLGSNIFNILGILGITAVLTPIRANPTILDWDAWWMVGASLLLLPLIATGRALVRWEAGLLLSVCAVYCATLV